MWSNLATHRPVRWHGCRILEQKQTKETMRESRFQIGVSLSSLPSVQNPSQSRPIAPNRAILCHKAIQSQPPSWSKSATSPILPRQAWSKPVKARQTASKRFQSLPSSHSSNRYHNILCTHQPNAQLIAVFCCSIHQYDHTIRNFRQIPACRAVATRRRVNPVLAFCLHPLAFPLSSTWGFYRGPPTALGRCWSEVVLLVADFFQPVHDFAVEGLGDGGVGHGGGGRRAMPVFFAGSKPERCHRAGFPQ